MTDLVSLTENEIYERIVVTVLDHRLPPGTKLIEDRLATAFGVSRTRIRPVLVRLANEQIVTLTPNRGATVAQPTEKGAREVFQVRQMIEATLMECFIKSDSFAGCRSSARCTRRGVLDAGAPGPAGSAVAVQPAGVGFARFDVSLLVRSHGR